MGFSGGGSEQKATKGTLICALEKPFCPETVEEELLANLLAKNWALQVVLAILGPDLETTAIHSIGMVGVWSGYAFLVIVYKELCNLQLPSFPETELRNVVHTSEPGLIPNKLFE